jgi:uncharacterized membrane protein
MQATVSAAGIQERPKLLMNTIAALAATGVAISSLSLDHHFSQSKTAFCDFGQSFNCDLVNRSSYSSVLGIPVALIGVGGYVLILALATIYRAKAESKFILALVSFAGLAFALYLTYIEWRVLGAWCVLCLSSLGVISGIAVLSTMATATKSHRS